MTRLIWSDKASGMHPVRLFRNSPRDFKLLRLPSSGGMSPVSSFLYRINSRRLTRFPSSGGMGPVSWFWERSSFSNPTSLPSSGGILPVSRLPFKNSHFSPERSPNSGGMVPWSPSGCRTSTRRGEPATLMPSQSSILRYALQFRSTPSPARASRTLNSISQSRIKSRFLLGLDTAPPDEQVGPSPSRHSEFSATRPPCTYLTPNPPRDGLGDSP